MPKHIHCNVQPLQARPKDGKRKEDRKDGKRKEDRKQRSTLTCRPRAHRCGRHAAHSAAFGGRVWGGRKAFAQCMNAQSYPGAVGAKEQGWCQPNLPATPWAGTTGGPRGCGSRRSVHRTASKGRLAHGAWVAARVWARWGFAMPLRHRPRLRKRGAFALDTRMVMYMSWVPPALAGSYASPCQRCGARALAQRLMAAAQGCGRPAGRPRCAVRVAARRACGVRVGMCRGTPHASPVAGLGGRLGAGVVLKDALLESSERGPQLRR
jgi:hypothetical protein